jgi:hypothetical protein
MEIRSTKPAFVPFLRSEKEKIRRWEKEQRPSSAKRAKTTTSTSRATSPAASPVPASPAPSLTQQPTPVFGMSTFSAGSSAFTPAHFAFSPAPAVAAAPATLAVPTVTPINFRQSFEKSPEPEELEEKPAESGLSMSLDEVRKHIQAYASVQSFSSVPPLLSVIPFPLPLPFPLILDTDPSLTLSHSHKGRELPLHTPNDARTALNVKAIEKWASLTSDNLERFREPLKKAVDEVLEQYLGRASGNELRSLAMCVSSSIVSLFFLSSLPATYPSFISTPALFSPLLLLLPNYSFSH